MRRSWIMSRAIGLGLVIAVGFWMICAPIPAVSAQVGTPAPTAGPQVHVVKAGEYLSVIAARYGLTTLELADANDMNPSDILAIGRELIIPGTTAEPSATPEPTASPTPEGGRIIVTVFEDTNGNGLRDEGEPALAGARVVVVGASDRPVAEHVSDGATDPYTFEALPPATYGVREEDPVGYTSTSANVWTVPLEGISEMEVFFGDRAIEPATAVPSAPAGADGSPVAAGSAAGSGGISGYVGILVAVVALALPFGLRALRGRQ